jgi:hypothetical protein
MNRYFCLFVLLFAGHAGSLFGQKQIEGHWGKTGPDVAYACAACNDGGYILTGLTKSGTDPNGDIVVIKTNDQGDTTWTMVYGGPFLEGGNSVMQTADGGFLVSGHTEDFGSQDCDAYLMKLDANGNHVWFKHYGGYWDDISESVIELPGGGFIFGGITASYGNNDTSQRRHVYFGKTNSAGDSIWTTYYAGSGNEYCYSIAAGQSGGFFAVGYSTSWGHGEDDGWLLNLNSNGDTLWTRFYRNGGDSRYYKILPTADHGYMLAGYTASSFTSLTMGLIIKLDANGNELWEKTFTDPTRNIIFHDVAQLPNGNYMFTGNIYNAIITGNVYILTTDENGRLISTTECGGVNSTSNCIAVQGNNSFLVAGSSCQYGDPTGDLYYFEMNNTDAKVPTVTLSQPRIYPDPVSNESMVIILPDAESNQKIDLQVLDMGGHIVMTQNNVLAKDILVNSNLVAPGTYLYRITCADGKRYNGKFVVK